MKIIIGSDHAAYQAKAEVMAWVKECGHEVLDAGTHSEDSCDYPDFAGKVAQMVSADAAGGLDDTRGILVCGTGIGMSIVANKFAGVRAALCHSKETAEMSRAHNNANILCMGARVLDMDMLKVITRTWLETSFEGGRHAKRLEKIRQFENS